MAELLCCSKDSTIFRYLQDENFKKKFFVRWQQKRTPAFVDKAKNARLMRAFACMLLCKLAKGSSTNLCSIFLFRKQSKTARETRLHCACIVI